MTRSLQLNWALKMLDVISFYHKEIESSRYQDRGGGVPKGLGLDWCFISQKLKHLSNLTAAISVLRPMCYSLIE